MSTGTAIYLYCLLRHADAPDPRTVESAPAGLPDASAPRVLPVEGDLWLIACDVPLAAYGEAALAGRMENLDWVSARALAHEEVVEHFTGTGSLVPMKLFTLFASEERALDHVRGARPRLGAILDHVAGREEWGVRVSYDAARAAREAVEEAAPAASGRDFLLRKKRVRDASRQAPAAAREAAAAVHEDLAARAADSRRRPPEAGQSLLLDGTYLVDRVDRECFEGAVEAAARRLGEAYCDVTLTGPWPPYNFSGEPR